MQEIKYVSTNTLKNVKLRADDLVFVLAMEDPGDSCDAWDDYEQFKEYNKSDQGKKGEPDKNLDIRE